ncbi:hypothetical protein O181_022375 [Austropuccinia psidii MF-1]|uniref:Integrase catalytic domain-containing protein n=1 Tax=Austropuccinia psidii MF-1 TaxID=1389203 RepID=A0A9Q3CGE2_9BASI|nr:hypothetical protein [Austropuccinia psidii MF-1]
MISTYSISTTLFTSSEKTPWNDRLGHTCPSVLKLLGIETDKNNCLICKTRKSHKLPFNNYFEKALNTLDCVHMDIVGPITPPLVSSNCYFLTIIDQALSLKIMKVLKKTDVFPNFCIAKKEMEKLQKKTLKWLVTDRGELFNHNFRKLSRNCGYTYIMAPP